MLKKPLLVLLAQRAEIAVMYHRDLEYIFQDTVRLVTLTVDDDPKIQAEILGQTDVLLITNPEIADHVRHLVSESCQILFLQFTFSKESIRPLNELPANTSALLCFHYYRVSLLTSSILYESGIRNLLLDAYPAEIGKAELKRDYDLAIVDNNSSAIPDGISRVISLADRKISLFTLISISNILHIWSPEIQDRIQAYCEDGLIDVRAYLPILQRNFWDQTQIALLMDRAESGVITLDPEYRVLNSNRKLGDLLPVRQNIQGLPLQSIPAFRDTSDTLVSKTPPENLVVENGTRKKLLFSREDVVLPWSQEMLHILFVDDIKENRGNYLCRNNHVAKYDFASIVGKSMAICNCIDRAQRIAHVDKPTLVIGESGTGKELFAQSIHNASPRSNRPFLALNCAAVPPSLLESELFGYVDGAFTGAKKGGRPGLFEQANGGTFFLDEIGELSMDLQAKLLRVLEEHEVMRVGGGEVISIDVRIISATNRNLRELVKAEKFRQDLYYRLNTLELSIPALRERKGDIPLLVKHFLEQEGLYGVRVSPEAMEFFEQFKWEGNVRELRNCIEYMAHICDGTITLEDLPAYIIQEFQESEKTPAARDAEWSGPAPRTILNEADHQLTTAILTALSRKKTSRVTLLETLRKDDPELSDYRLRQMIDHLRQVGMIQVNQGRRGMELTDLGARFIGR